MIIKKKFSRQKTNNENNIYNALNHEYIINPNNIMKN